MLPLLAVNKFIDAVDAWTASNFVSTEAVYSLNVSDLVFSEALNALSEDVLSSILWNLDVLFVLIDAVHKLISVICPFTLAVYVCSVENLVSNEPVLILISYFVGKYLDKD